MKRELLNLSSVICLLLIVSGCKDKIFKKHTAYVPVYVSYEEFREMPTFESPHTLTKHGNIYIKDSYLFIVDSEKGIHFIDNTNPSTPNNVGFLKIPGCTGMQIKGNYLYANSYIDLVVFDISSKTNPTIAGRVEDAFPDALPSLDNGKYSVTAVEKKKGVVVGWELETVKEEQQLYYGYTMLIDCATCDQNMVLFTSEASSLSSPNNVGISGSITKFTIINDHLYVMDRHQLRPFNLSDPINPDLREGVTINREVETLFSYDQHIFMGTTTGMLIYNTNNPDRPEYVSVVEHWEACDPVVVQGDYAYVTVRSGRRCGGDINQLDVINVSDYNNPFIENSFAMSNPHGLGISGDLLFICDGSDGLKVFDASNPADAGNQMVHHFPEITAIDIIPFNGLAITIGENSLKQYDYTNPGTFQLLSTLNINQ